MAKKRRTLVLGISGSPRKGGNTDVLVQEVLKGAKKAGARTQFVNVAGLKISPCVACYHCAKHNGKCAIKDDMQRLYAMLKRSDVWVFGTPVYWFHVSAQLKAPMDRMFAFIFDKSEPMKGKRAAVVTTSGDADVREMARHIWGSFATACRFTGVKLAGRLAVQGVNKEDAKKRWTGFKRAQRLGARLARC